MSKIFFASLLAFSVAASLAACSKEQPAQTAAAPGTTQTAQMADQPHPMPAEMADQPHPMPSTAETDVNLSGIAKAEGGQTVADVYAGKTDLEGETVTVRGKVVKVNAGIMGRNWLHVRDGSGGDGTNDLTVTTSEPVPAVGDLVVISGAVALNKDFGMGYRYPVIVENAAVTVETD